MKPSELKSEKEKIYDEQISSLMKQIIDICKEHKISLFADFGFDPIPQVEDDEGRYPSDSCRTSLMGEEYNSHWIYNHFNVIYECRSKDRAVNIDKYLMWLEKEVRELGSHSSIYLSQMGISPETGKRRELPIEKRL